MRAHNPRGAAGAASSFVAETFPVEPAAFVDEAARAAFAAFDAALEETLLAGSVRSWEAASPDAPSPDVERAEPRSSEVPSAPRSPSRRGEVSFPAVLLERS